LRALIVEHSHQDIDSMLFEPRESGFLVKHTLVETREDFRAALAGNNFDAVLADYQLPNWSGLDALAELRRTGKDTPFLLVGGTLGEEAAVECIKQGASDYILKDHLSRLPIALMRAMAEKGPARRTCPRARSAAGLGGAQPKLGGPGRRPSSLRTSRRCAFWLPADIPRSRK
jgi:DNA-binding NtrC family response regulator